MDAVADTHSLREKYPLLKDWAEGVSKNKTRVKVLHRANYDSNGSANGVEYQLHKSLGTSNPRFYHVFPRFNLKIVNEAKRLKKEGCNVCIHYNSLILPINLFILSLMLPKSIRIIVQTHAERPRNVLYNLLCRLSISRIDTVFFTNSEVAKPWIRKGIIDQKKIKSIMECGALVESVECIDDNNITSLSASPLVLWTGQLNSNKDPLLVLKGMERFFSVFSAGRMIMLYGQKADLIDDVKALISSSDILSKHVEIIGTVPFNRVKNYYLAADIFVQGSHSEGSGLAVLDAMSCSAVPVVTNIPSFKELCGDQSFLWEPDNLDSFVKQLSRLMEDFDLESEKLKAKSRFDKYWTIDRITKTAITHYFPEDKNLDASRG